VTIHKEGYLILGVTATILVAVNVFSDYLLENLPIIREVILILTVIVLLLFLQFFRHPARKIISNEKHVLAPADGKVVVIEETDESEVLKDRRIQISIFMSPVNVHVNRYPVSGKVTYCVYHPGQYLVAWHPKSSTENERTTVVIETAGRVFVLVRQIAGAVARRIVCYPKKDWLVKQGDEMGFIKFGSRVDVFLPLDAKIKVELNQKVVGGETVLAEI